ncbi:NAD(P)H-dependent oxidoreductase [Kribbella lupini]|uniref:NAD(P)H-dependent oxidoreductase n=1 Tax=Kribbella lupini TaxID=291602 RepID=A0ABN2AT70_9ACTN
MLNESLRHQAAGSACPRTFELGIVVGSTRPGRKGAAVAQWALEVTGAHTRCSVSPVRITLLDLADFGLPLLDEPVPAAMGAPTKDHTRRWAAAVGACDGFVFVTPEYNHSLPAALKNAIDFVCTEWHDKAAGLLGYGVAGGVRAVEHLRQILAEVRVADVRTAVALSLYDDFAGDCPAPRAHQHVQLRQMVDEVIAWSGALSSLRRR